MIKHILNKIDSYCLIFGNYDGLKIQRCSKHSVPVTYNIEKPN